MAAEAQQRSLGYRSGSILSPESPSHARLASLCRVLRCLLTRLRGFDFLVRLFSKPQTLLGGTNSGFENAGFFSGIKNKDVAHGSAAAWEHINLLGEYD